MMDLARMRCLARERANELPWWVSEVVEDTCERIEELERQLEGVMDTNEEMYAMLKFYAALPHGERARQITER